jgi:hypothetical protein
MNLHVQRSPAHFRLAFECILNLIPAFHRRLRKLSKAVNQSHSAPQLQGKKLRFQFPSGSPVEETVARFDLWKQV